MKNACPPVTINVDAIVERVKDSILGGVEAKPAESVMDGSVHRIAGLGKIGFMPEKLDGTQFVLGFVTLPSVINFATRLMDAGIVFPQVDRVISRSVATGLTLAANLLMGGKSFLLGAFLGQFPSTLDDIAGVAVTAIQAKRGGAAAKGLGASSEEAQLLKLRSDLERLQGIGDSMEMEPEMSGFDMVVN
jgi:hypothetical protein